MFYLFLINPAAGKTDASGTLIPALETALAQCGIPRAAYRIQKTEYPGHARELAATAAQSGEEVFLYAAGGDGTLNEALCGVHGYANAAVGCLPCGSGNDFLRSFGTKEEFLNLESQLHGSAVPVDLIATPRGLAASICSAGLDAQVAYDIPRFRRLPFCGGEMAYRLSILHQLTGRLGRVLQFDIDGETFEEDCLMTAVCNGRAYGGGFFAAPEARLDDGYLDVFIVRKVGRVRIAKILPYYQHGRHFQNGTVIPALADVILYRRAKNVAVRPTDGRGPLIVTVDGECGPASLFSAHVEPLGARVILPKTVYKRYIEEKVTL